MCLRMYIVSKCSLSEYSVVRRSFTFHYILDPTVAFVMLLIEYNIMVKNTNLKMFLEYNQYRIIFYFLSFILN